MTLDFLGPYYLWTKALHLISVFAWMAGLFYLPRLRASCSRPWSGGCCGPS
jgi:uncharacterized membrane protein